MVFRRGLRVSFCARMSLPGRAAAIVETPAPPTRRPARLRGRLVLGCAALASASGCMMATPAAEVPSWAMHVRPARWNPAVLNQAPRAQLLQEMAKPGLADGHMSPEQIGVVAVREIELGHPGDAALWLAIASYRYHQEAMHAVSAGSAGLADLPFDVNPRAYRDLVSAEIDRYARLHFHRELEVLTERIQGRGGADSALQDQMTALGKSSAIDRESLRDVLAELRPSAGATVTSPANAPLAEAFRRRLLADFELNQDDYAPGFYLGRTPLASLQKDALFATRTFFEAALCAGVAEGFPAHRSTVVQALTTSPRPQIRANAAAILGLAPSAETRPLLEAQLARETNRLTKLALAFALVHHGQAEHLVALTAELQTCRAGMCALPASLIQWLPEAQKDEVDEALLARLVASTSFEPRARMFAAAALRDRGRRKPLQAATIEALLVTARQRGEEGEFAAPVAVDAVRESEILAHDDVVARISPDGAAEFKRDRTFPGPLLARLSVVSVEDDLPLLRRMMDRFGVRRGPEADFIIAAAARLTRPAVDAVLVNWFNQHERLRPQLAGVLATRKSVSPVLLERLLAKSDARTRIVAQLAADAPEAASTVLRYLQNAEIDDLWAAAELAGATAQVSARQRLHGLLNYTDARFYPNDVLVRHAAMAALVRIALVMTKAPGSPVGAPAPTGPAAIAPAVSVPPAGSSSPSTSDRLPSP